LDYYLNSPVSARTCTELTKIYLC